MTLYAVTGPLGCAGFCHVIWMLCDVRDTHWAFLGGEDGAVRRMKSQKFVHLLCKGCEGKSNHAN